MVNHFTKATRMKTVLGWLVHAYTASSTILGLLTLEAICMQHFVEALWWMALTIFVDATDGTLARRFKVSQTIPKIDGALLDNLVDFINYVVTPCFFLLMSPLLPVSLKWVVVGAIAMSSAYQFAQVDAKTEDHFFKGFPCYWNIVVFYLFILNSDPSLNAGVLLVFSVLVFVPVKYVYPSRMDNVSQSRWPRLLLLLASTIFCASCLWLLWIYPRVDSLVFGYSLVFIALYVGVSLYRTVNPLQIVKRFTE
jgi:phosphatidylcholine synthase